MHVCSDVYKCPHAGIHVYCALNVGWHVCIGSLYSNVSPTAIVKRDDVFVVYRCELVLAFLRRFNKISYMCMSNFAACTISEGPDE